MGSGFLEISVVFFSLVGGRYARRIGWFVVGFRFGLCLGEGELDLYYMLESCFWRWFFTKYLVAGLFFFLERISWGEELEDSLKNLG